MHVHICASSPCPCHTSHSCCSSASHAPDSISGPSGSGIHCMRTDALVCLAHLSPLFCITKALADLSTKALPCFMFHFY
jgi:hypothetical protein